MLRLPFRASLACCNKSCMATLPMGAERARGSNFLASNGRKPVDRNVGRKLKHRALLRCLQQRLLCIVEWQLLCVKGLLRRTPLWQASCNVLLAL